MSACSGGRPPGQNRAVTKVLVNVQASDTSDRPDRCGSQAGCFGTPLPRVLETVHIPGASITAFTRIAAMSLAE